VRSRTIWVYAEFIVFTFGGPGGFQYQFGGPGVQRRRPAAAAPADNTPTSPLVALLPLLLFFLFAAVTVIPNLIFGPAPVDPSYSFEASKDYDLARTTWHWGIPYWVNTPEWEKSHVYESIPEARRTQKDAAMFSTTVRQFERSVETTYSNRLHNEVCPFRV